MDERKNYVTVTRGMANSPKQAARTCPSCNLKIPRYPGRYPLTCPSCSSVLRAPTTEEQLAMVEAGVPATDVAKFVAEGYIPEDVFSDLSAAWSTVKGKAKGAKGHVKKSIGDIKKAAGNIGKERKGYFAAEERLKKAQERLKKAQRKLANTPKGTKKEEEVKEAVKQAEAAVKEADAAFKEIKKKVESLEENKMDWKTSIYRNQIPVIKRVIEMAIEKDGRASLIPITQKFRMPTLTLRSLIEAHAEGWGVILSEDFVYLKKEGEPISETNQKDERIKRMNEL